MTHEEKTRLIAEFMEDEEIDHPAFGKIHYFKNAPTTDACYHWNVKRMQYSESYDWLMPVWHKFRDLRFTDLRQEIMHAELLEVVGRSIINKSIEYAFTQLAEAIEWYNTTKK